MAQFESESGPLNLFPLAGTYYRLGIIGLSFPKQRIWASFQARDALFCFSGLFESESSFPYMALNDAVELAEAIHGNVGLGEKWSQTAANIFDLVYSGDGGIVVSLARADRSPRAHDE